MFRISDRIFKIYQNDLYIFTVEFFFYIFTTLCILYRFKITHRPKRIQLLTKYVLNFTFQYKLCSLTRLSIMFSRVPIKNTIKNYSRIFIVTCMII